MLSLSDIDIEKFIPIFAHLNVPVAFLVPTPTGFSKSIMDATAPIRELFLDTHLHDYEKQAKGQEHKKFIKTYLVEPTSLIKTDTSLYRPITKNGDPRMWIYELKKYCLPCNLLALVVYENALYVLNLSNPMIEKSLLQGGFCYDILSEIHNKYNSVSNELLAKLKEIHNRGFLPSITSGDPGVGDTLEHALGINRNNSKAPDYKGIELKTTRLTRNGVSRPSTRITLFTKVPDEGMTYRQIVDKYGKWQIPKGSYAERFQLYDTLKCSHPNSYNLMLSVNEYSDKLDILYKSEKTQQYVSSWIISELKRTLLKKHPETFWVKAISKNIDGREYFRYDKVLHTKNPNTSLLAPLLEIDKITVDLAAHYDSNQKWRDHGVLFKIFPTDLHLLLGEPIIYNL